MKLTITREQLQEGLVAVAASVPTKTTLPVLANLLLEASRDGLRLSGTDLDIAVEYDGPGGAGSGRRDHPARRASWSRSCASCRATPSASSPAASSG